MLEKLGVGWNFFRDVVLLFRDSGNNKWKIRLWILRVVCVEGEKGLVYFIFYFIEYDKSSVNVKGVNKDSWWKSFFFSVFIFDCIRLN